MIAPMNEPRVAVVVPCFNDGETLLETLDSLRREEPHELIVVDDGSSDPKTLAVFTRIEREGIRVLHQPNRGLSAARMNGVESTRSRFLLALDSDDKLCAGALTLLADALDADQELACAWGDYISFGDENCRIRTWAALDAYVLAFVNRMPVVAMFRREALLASGGWRLAGGWEDWALWRMLAVRGEHGVHVGEPIFLYRRHGERMARETARRADEQWRRLCEIAPIDHRSHRAESVAGPLLRLALPAIARLPVPRIVRIGLAERACELALAEQPKNGLASQRRA